MGILRGTLGCGTVLLMLLTATSLRAGQTIIDRELGMVFKIPDGFESVPFQSAENPRLRYVLHKINSRAKTPSTVICIEELKGPLNQHLATQKRKFEESQGEVALEKWKGLA